MNIPKNVKKIRRWYIATNFLVSSWSSISLIFSHSNGNSIHDIFLKFQNNSPRGSKIIGILSRGVALYSDTVRYVLGWLAGCLRSASYRFILIMQMNYTTVTCGAVSVLKWFIMFWIMSLRFDTLILANAF